MVFQCKCTHKMYPFATSPKYFCSLNTTQLVFWKKTRGIDFHVKFFEQLFWLLQGQSGVPCLGLLRTMSDDDACRIPHSFGVTKMHTHERLEAENDGLVQMIFLFFSGYISTLGLFSFGKKWVFSQFASTKKTLSDEKTTRTLPEVYSYSSDLGGGNSNISLFSPRKFGKMIQFDLRIFFQMGCFNPPPIRDDFARSCWWLRSHCGA